MALRDITDDEILRAATFLARCEVESSADVALQARKEHVAPADLEGRCVAYWVRALRALRDHPQPGQETAGAIMTGVTTAAAIYSVNVSPGLVVGWASDAAVPAFVWPDRKKDEVIRRSRGAGVIGAPGRVADTGRHG